MAVTRLSRETSLLLVVDLQERLLPSISNAARVVHATVTLEKAAAALGVPSILTTQYAKGLGAVDPQVLAHAEGQQPMDKTTFGCFQSTAIADAVRAMGRTEIVMVGVETHICVLQTCLSALDRGYRVHVVSEGVSSRTEENRTLGLARMEQSGATISSVEMAVYEWLGEAGTPEFKALLPLLK